MHLRSRAKREQADLDERVAAILLEARSIPPLTSPIVTPESPHSSNSSSVDSNMSYISNDISFPEDPLRISPVSTPLPWIPHAETNDPGLKVRYQNKPNHGSSCKHFKRSTKVPASYRKYKTHADPVKARTHGDNIEDPLAIPWTPKCSRIPRNTNGNSGCEKIGETDLKGIPKYITSDHFDDAITQHTKENAMDTPKVNRHLNNREQNKKRNENGITKHTNKSILEHSPENQSPERSIETTDLISIIHTPPKSNYISEDIITISSDESDRASRSPSLSPNSDRIMRENRRERIRNRVLTPYRQRLPRISNLSTEEDLIPPTTTIPRNGGSSNKICEQEKPVPRKKLVDLFRNDFEGCGKQGLGYKKDDGEDEAVKRFLRIEKYYNSDRWRPPTTGVQYSINEKGEVVLHSPVCLANTSSTLHETVPTTVIIDLTSSPVKGDKINEGTTGNKTSLKKKSEIGDKSAVRLEQLSEMPLSTTEILSTPETLQTKGSGTNDEMKNDTPVLLKISIETAATDEFPSNGPEADDEIPEVIEIAATKGHEIEQDMPIFTKMSAETTATDEFPAKGSEADDEIPEMIEMDNIFATKGHEIELDMPILTKMSIETPGTNELPSKEHETDDEINEIANMLITTPTKWQEIDIDMPVLMEMFNEITATNEPIPLEELEIEDSMPVWSVVEATNKTAISGYVADDEITLLERCPEIMDDNISSLFNEYEIDITEIPATFQSSPLARNEEYQEMPVLTMMTVMESNNISSTKIAATTECFPSERNKVEEEMPVSTVMTLENKITSPSTVDKLDADVPILATINATIGVTSTPDSQEIFEESPLVKEDDANTGNQGENTEEIVVIVDDTEDSNSAPVGELGPADSSNKRKRSSREAVEEEILEANRWVTSPATKSPLNKSKMLKLKMPDGTIKMHLCTDVEDISENN